jgi:hypothetical protein
VLITQYRLPAKYGTNFADKRRSLVRYSFSNGLISPIDEPQGQCVGQYREVDLEVGDDVILSET